MLVRLTLVMMLCGSGALMASGVRVLVKHVPIERVLQKFRLQDFPAQALKRDTQLVPSAAAFVDELLQASCQSCFAEIFAEKNFQHYRIVEQLDDEYVEAYARKLSDHSLFLFHSSFPPSSFPDYDVTVSLTDEAALADSLLDRFAKLDRFYLAMREAQQQIDTNMPVDGVRRDVFAAQREKYTELYQHTRDEIDAVLADLRGLLDEHGREYPHEVLASADNLDAHLRRLAQARDAWSRNIETAVTNEATPRMLELQERGEKLLQQTQKEKELEMRLPAELQARRSVRGIMSAKEFDEGYSHQSYKQNDSNGWHTEHQRQQEQTLRDAGHAAEQQRQQEEQNRLNEMAAIIIDPFDIF